eukprot:m.117997 g.117997  ORF g.117997 m.117997 type:complete len:1136 (-) comp15442_c0_seq1:491-3898(-)
MASSFSPDVLAKLHRNTNAIRNICILAHVDHGKTTLADALLASNGIISTRMSGKLRYLDSRQDEQMRGITMKSNAVTLLHKADGKPYIINIIDSPGHVDFSSEVSTAVRLSDGAIVLVDVVEGVSAQTHAVLRQAWVENLTPCLVLNKIDRLISELKLTPAEAYAHLWRVLEQVNAITASLFTTSMIEKLDEQAENADAVFDADIFEESDDTGLYFEPERGNVIFASAIDGWGFTVFDFADIVSAKLGCNSRALRRCLWGDYFLAKEKTGIKVRKGAYNKGKTPLFVRFVLEPIWSMYQVVVEETNLEKMKKMTGSVGVKVTARDWQAEPKVLMQSIMSRWLPLATCVMNVVSDKLPPPTRISEERAKALLFSSKRSPEELSPELRRILDAITACDIGDQQDSPCVAFVSKMVAFEKSMLPEHQLPKASVEELRQKRAALLAERRRKEQEPRQDGVIDVASDGVPLPEHNEGDNQPLDSQESESGEGNASPTKPRDDEEKAKSPEDFKDKEKENDIEEPWVFLAYTRVFAGTLRPGQKIHVLGPRYDPRRPNEHRTEVTIQSLYLLMGRSVLPLNEAPAGTVVGILGLEGQVLKSATLANTAACPRLRGLYEHTKPIVRVALETQRISDMPALHRGMQLLNKADPCVEVFVQETGELVLVAAGEVHIERCLTDLRETFAPGIRINVSPPIVPFRETIVPPPTVDVTKEAITAENTMGVRKCYLLNEEDVDMDQDKVVSVATATKRWTLKLRARPLPPSVLQLLQEHGSLLRKLSTALSDKARDVSRRLRSKATQVSSTMKATEGPTQTESGEIEDGMDHSSAVSPQLSVSERTSISDEPGREEDEQLDQADVDDGAMTASELCAKLKQAFDEAGPEWSGAQDAIVSFGPRHSGTNILTTNPRCPYPGVFGTTPEVAESPLTTELLSHLNPLIVSFQLVTQAGPLCEEPMMGVCFDVVDIVVNQEAEYPERLFSGHLISTMREACRQAFLVQHVRLMTAVYSCDLLVNSGSLGKVYGVLSKRNGKIISEEMREGSDSFQIKAKIPVTHSFGFAEELRKRTSGLAIPQLVFSHWEVIDEDPFWVPTTEEEKTHFGEKGDAPNLARKYMDDTRKRKGLYIERKIVEFAEKQRTISKNK